MPPPDGRGPTFDEAVCAKIKLNLGVVAAEHPEVDGVAVTVVWRAGLNGPGVQSGFWLCFAQDADAQCAAQLAAVHQTTVLQECIMAAARAAVAALLAEREELRGQVKKNA